MVPQSLSEVHELNALKSEMAQALTQSFGSGPVSFQLNHRLVERTMDVREGQLFLSSIISVRYK